MRSSLGPRRVAVLLVAAGLALPAGCAKEKAPEAPAGSSAGVGAAGAEGPATHVVPYGVCAIDWTVVGGAGAESADGTQPVPPPEVRVTTSVTEGDEFVLATGGDGGDPDDGLEQWQGGVNAGGVDLANGSDGDRAQGGGGGGAASVVLYERNAFVVAPGGTGAGAGGGAGGSPAGRFPDVVVPNPDRDYSGPARPGDAPGTITAEDVPCDPQGPGIPRDVTVTPGIGTLTVSWAPPADTGPEPIAGYEVHAVARIEGGPADDDQTCSVGASETSCVLELGSAFRYQVDVAAVDAAGTRGAAARTEGAPLQVDYSVPTPDGEPLDARGLDDAAAGGPVEFSASGLPPGSFVRVLLFPGNAELAQFPIDAKGHVSGSLRLPPDLLPPGPHSLVVWVIDPADDHRYLRADFTV